MRPASLGSARPAEFEAVEPMTTWNDEKNGSYSRCGELRALLLLPLYKHAFSNSLQRTLYSIFSPDMQQALDYFDFTDFFIYFSREAQWFKVTCQVHCDYSSLFNCRHVIFVLLKERNMGDKKNRYPKPRGAAAAIKPTARSKIYVVNPWVPAHTCNIGALPRVQDNPKLLWWCRDVKSWNFATVAPRAGRRKVDKNAFLPYRLSVTVSELVSRRLLYRPFARLRSRLGNGKGSSEICFCVNWFFTFDNRALSNFTEFWVTGVMFQSFLPIFNIMRNN